METFQILTHFLPHIFHDDPLPPADAEAFARFVEQVRPYGETVWHWSAGDSEWFGRCDATGAIGTVTEVALVIVGQRQSCMGDVHREPYAWPGGYPRYAVDADGDTFCPSCCQHYVDTSCSIEVNWEDPDLFCCECGSAIEVAYEK